MGMIAGAPRTGFRVEPGAPLVALLGGVALALGALASLVHLDAWGIPLCMFKASTGYPCMTCGGTRAIVRLAHLDFAGALTMNPMVAVGLLLLVPWALLDALLALRGQSLVLGIGPRASRILPWLIAPVVLLNWAYLIAVGR